MTDGTPGDGMAAGNKEFLDWWGLHCALVGVVPGEDMTAMAFAAWQAAPQPLDMDRFEDLLDRLESLCEARRIKAAPHPIRARLLEGLQWALNLDSCDLAPWVRAELRRRSGL